MSRSEVRKTRIALNESAYRAMNEWIRAGQRPDGALTIICECGHENCCEEIRLAGDKYEAVRENPKRFVMSPGHLLPDVECRVEGGADHWIVEKFDDAAELVEETDPRRDSSHSRYDLDDEGGSGST
jgi:hypothetical protein